MSAFDRAFGKSTKLPYNLTIRFNGGFIWALGELSLQAEEARAESGYYCQQGVDFSILRQKASNRFFHGDLVVKRAQRLYFIEILEGKEILHAWSADLSTHDIAGTAMLKGKIGQFNREWGIATLALSLSEK